MYQKLVVLVIIGSRARLRNSKISNLDVPNQVGALRRIKESLLATVAWMKWIVQEQMNKNQL
jgi:hypothetical protein